MEEPFGKGQKGSSAMPHKQNPIVAERISGLARVLRANALVGLENVALWHERDISHSSAERVVLPDSTIALDYMLDRFTWLAEGWWCTPSGCCETSRPRTAWCSPAGRCWRWWTGPRARACLRGGTAKRSARVGAGAPFRDLLERDAEAAAVLDPAALDRVFDLQDYLRHVDEVFDRTTERLGAAGV